MRCITCVIERMDHLPPKQRFTNQDILEASLNILRRDGLDGLTARNLGSELGSSSRPVFTVYKNMEEVQKETIKAARVIYNTYIEKGLAEENAFKGVGMQYIRFAVNEPRLFGLLFMMAGERHYSLNEILPIIDDNSDKILASIQEEYKLPKDASYKLYQNMWIFTHGIACLCATGVGNFLDDESSALLTEVFTSILIKIKSEGKSNG